MISHFLRMNQQNITKTPDLPVKRKRGRPRKDETVPRTEKPHTQPPPQLPSAATAPPPAVVMKTIQPQPPLPPSVIPITTTPNKIDHNMVGQTVTCVIDGIFDNGYLISTRMGPNNSVLRGIVFQQGHVSPVTPANDVAPHVEMSRRGDFPIPPSNPRNPIQVCTPQSVCAKQHVVVQNYQNTPSMVTPTGGSSSSAPPESLRLIEQDDVMQVFEVAKTVEEPRECDQRAKNENMVVADPAGEGFQIPMGNMNPEFVASLPVVASQATEAVDEGENQSGPLEPPVHKPVEHEPVVDEADRSVKEPDGENPEVITPVEAEGIIRNSPMMGKDEVHQESKEETGEVSNVGANQDPSREVAVDLSLSNFHEI